MDGDVRSHGGGRCVRAYRSIHYKARNMYVYPNILQCASPRRSWMMPYVVVAPKRTRHTLAPTSPWTPISRTQYVRQIYLCTPERTSPRATMMVSSGEDACHIYKSLEKESLLLLARCTPCPWVHRPILVSTPSIHFLRRTEDANAHAHDEH